MSDTPQIHRVVVTLETAFGDGVLHKDVIGKYDLTHYQHFVFVHDPDNAIPEQIETADICIFQSRQTAVMNNLSQKSLLDAAEMWDGAVSQFERLVKRASKLRQEYCNRKKKHSTGEQNGQS